jgi:carbonic anhydrase/acetyltransferase-like protein (isoleucine patch superfamily)
LEKNIRKGECEMKNIKFELTENTINREGYTLYQIKACKAFVTSSGIEISEGELGGWVEKEENLSQEGGAWVWKDARVCGTARVYGDAEIWGAATIWGNAKVCGNAKVAGNSKISGNAVIKDGAEIWGNAKISDYAEILEDATIRDNAEVSGDAKIFGNAAIKGNSKVAGKAIIFGDSEVWGDAIITGCSKVFGDAKIGGDAFISSPDNVLSITPIGKYRVSLTLFKTKNNSIKVSYNWEIYTLEKFQSVMNDWTEEEIKIAKAAIEILGGC